MSGTGVGFNTAKRDRERERKRDNVHCVILTISMLFRKCFESYILFHCLSNAIAYRYIHILLDAYNINPQ